MVSLSGVLLVDKPAGMTSHDVVAWCRRIYGTKKVGHAGTLDPMATGLLLVGVGTATRLLTYLVGCEKTYEATIRLGQATTTDDREGEVIATAPAARLAELSAHPESIRAAVTEFLGDIAQVPTTVSAIKIAGKRAYQLARKGEDVALAPRPVHIAQFTVHSIETAEGGSTPALDVRVTVRCSAGTYVRALARDLGEALGVGGHLTALRRTRVGGFTVADAATAQALDAATPPRRRRGEPLVHESVEAGKQREAARAALPLLTPAETAQQVLPVWSVTAAEAQDLRHGKRVAVSARVCADIDADTAPTRVRKRLWAAVAEEDTPQATLVAVVEARASEDGGALARVRTGFPAPENLSAG